MSDDLADLLLDSTAPIHARKAAGYALLRIGTPAARIRLSPLFADAPDDPTRDLKGLALRCNWPGGLTASALLAALTPPPSDSYHGAYDYFLFELDHNGFDAAGDRLAGLKWALQSARRGEDHQSTMQIARRIAIAALKEIHEAGVADALADLVLQAAQTHAGSPLQRPQRVSLTENEEQDLPAALSESTAVRRAFIVALVARNVPGEDLWWVAHQTPGLLAPDDFPWLLERATDPLISLSRRKNYAELASMLSWEDTRANVEAWLAVREIEPIASRFPDPLYVTLDSREAATAKERYHQIRRMDRSERLPPPTEVGPPPAERVSQVLLLSETRDSRFFLNLCDELTLNEDSTAYGFERFLIRTPGWARADIATRHRIVEAAKRLLMADTDEPERVRTMPLNSILYGHMAALWLAMDCDPTWVNSLPEAFWQRWAWYIMREVRQGLHSEPTEPKTQLLRKVHEHASHEVRAAVEEFATAADTQVSNPLPGVLDLLQSIRDDDLDARLCELMTKGRLQDERVRDVAQFVLARSNNIGLSACLSFIEPSATAKAESVTIQSAVALLHERTTESWESVLDFIKRRPDLSSRVLTEFAHRGRFFRRDGDPSPLARLNSIQIGQLAALLIEAFPPEQDPQYAGAHPVGPVDSAVEMRDQLVSWLGDQRDFEAVEALRVLERRFGNKYPWIRHPRACAERSFRLSHWTPIPLKTIAELLAARTKRLIRSERDATDGIVVAMEQFEKRLQRESPSPLERLWNRPKKGRPTPKDEEHVSDELCMAVREYFNNYAVTADREVQIFRRKLPKTFGGAPGSEVDVLCRVSAIGTVSGDPVIVPIEVKMANNPEARSGLRDQLVDRYMRQTGTTSGVFCVAYMGTPTSTGAYKPLWPTPAAAKEDLESQAQTTMHAAPELDVRVVVVDASLPRTSKSKASNRRARVRKSKKQIKSSKNRTPQKATNKKGQKKVAKKKTPVKRKPKGGSRSRRSRRSG